MRACVGNNTIRLIAFVISILLAVSCTSLTQVQRPKPIIKSGSPKLEFEALGINKSDIEQLMADIRSHHLEPILSSLRKNTSGPNGVLPSSIHSLLGAIRIDIPTQDKISGWPQANAGVDPESGNDVIRIDALYILALEKVSELIALKATHHPQADAIRNKALKRYAAQLKNYNSWRIQIPFTFNIFDFLSEEEGAREISQAKDVVITDILTWVVLHEIAHHLLGHFDVAQFTELRNLKEGPEQDLEKRRLELAADQRSFELMKQIGAGIDSLGYYVALQSELERSRREHGLELPKEQGSHPSWEARSKAFWNFFIGARPAFSPTGWIVFKNDKFLEPGLFVSERFLIPADPISWISCGLWIQGIANRGRGPVRLRGIEIDDSGAVHMFSRSRMTPEVVINRPRDYYSELIDINNFSGTGDRHQDYFQIKRDSTFYYEEGVYERSKARRDMTGKGIREEGPPNENTLQELLKESPKSALMRAVTQAVQDRIPAERLEEIVNQRLRREGALYLKYKRSGPDRGDEPRDEYRREVEALQFEYQNEFIGVLGPKGMFALETALTAHPLHKLMTAEIFKQKIQW